MVLLTLPRSAALVEGQLRDRQKQIAGRNKDLATALEAARLAIRDGRQNADPRRYGQAQAILAPWWSMEAPPPEARLLRAVLRQALHDFAGAKADLDAILEIDPAAAQARLSRAFVLQATGAFEAAKDDCRMLPPRIGRLAVAVCLARMEALMGENVKGLDRIGLAILRDRGADPEICRWAAAAAAEIALSLGNADAAELWFGRALESRGDVPTLVAYADYLLDAGRPADVLTLLADRASGDVVLLRLAIAAKATRDPRLQDWTALLAEGFALARSSGNEVHLREEARFALEILGDARRGLELAGRNWAVQKEPADVRLLLAAALEARDFNAAADALAFVEAVGLKDVRLKPLVDQLTAQRGEKRELALH